MRKDDPKENLNGMTLVHCALPKAIKPTSPATGFAHLSPLHWWRTLPPTSFTEAHLDTLTAVLSRLAVIRERQWAAAAAGDGATAVGIALRAAKGDFLTLTVEVAMTALLPPAIVGDPAAALVLAAIIERMVAGSAGSQLANAWLEYADLHPDEYGDIDRLTFQYAADVDLD